MPETMPDTPAARPQTVFLTGGSGFVGGHVARALLGLPRDAAPGGDQAPLLSDLESDAELLRVPRLRLLGRLREASPEAAVEYFAKGGALQGAEDALRGAVLVGNGSKDGSDLLRRERVQEEKETKRREREGGVPLLTVLQGSLKDAGALDGGLRDCDVVVHSAALAADCGTWENFFDANVLGTASLMAACEREMDRRISIASVDEAVRPLLVVELSTVDVYGYPLSTSSNGSGALDEDRATVLSEWFRSQSHDDAAENDLSLKAIRSHSTRPLPYCTSKAGAEEVVARARRRAGFSTVTVRPANVYGGVLSQFSKEIRQNLEDRLMLYAGDGSSSGGFVHVDDVVRAILLCVARGKEVDGLTFNVSAGDATWRDFTEALADDLRLPHPWLHLPFWLIYAIGMVLEVLWWIVGLVWPISSRPPLTRMASYLLANPQHFSTQHIEAALGWRPQVGYRDGVRRAAVWLEHERQVAAESKKGR
jgi:nucleoside-diphosphate-sugar epimerase